MLIVWLMFAVRWCLRLIFPPPPGAPVTRIDPKMPCKLCGHKGSTLRAVEVAQGRGDTAMRRVVVRQICDRCGGGYDYVPLTPNTAEVTHVFVPATSAVYEPLKLNGRAR